MTNYNCSLLPLRIAYKREVLKGHQYKSWIILNFYIPKIANIFLELSAFVDLIMETMSLFFLLLTMWTTATSSTWASQQPLREIPTIATLNLTNPASYPTFITDLRDTLSEKNKNKQYVLQCGIKKIDPNPSSRYAYIDIIATNEQTVTLAIDQTNIYVMGYRDRYNGNDRAFFFKEEYDKAKDLFPNANGNNRVKLGYTAQYTSLGDRTKVPLGIDALITSVANIYGKASNKKLITLQQKFFLIAIQMVAEATRFKYIASKIPPNDYDSFTPDAKVVALENGWDTLSTAIYDKTQPSSTPSTCKLTVQSVKLQDQWTFVSVEQISNVLGILRAKATTIGGDVGSDDAGTGAGAGDGAVASY